MYVVTLYCSCKHRCWCTTTGLVTHRTWLYLPPTYCMLWVMWLSKRTTKSVYMNNSDLRHKPPPLSLSQCAIRRRKSFQSLVRRAGSQVFASAQVNMSARVRDQHAVQRTPQQEPSCHNRSKPLNGFETVEMARRRKWIWAGSALSRVHPSVAFEDGRLFIKATSVLSIGDMWQYIAKPRHATVHRHL